MIIDQSGNLSTWRTFVTLLASFRYFLTNTIDFTGSNTHGCRFGDYLQQGCPLDHNDFQVSLTIQRWYKNHLG
jgi:hypothetical protein